MTGIWMIKSGSQNEYEAFCLEDSRIFLSISLLAQADFTEVENYADIRKRIEEIPEVSAGPKLTELCDDMADFCLRISRGDLVLMPLKESGRVAIGKILSPYGYDSGNPLPLRHLREVEWITKEAVRESFDPGVTTAFGDDHLISRITHPSAERQIFAEIGKAMQKSSGRGLSLDDRPVLVPDTTLDARLQSHLAPAEALEARIRQDDLNVPVQDRVRVSVREEASSPPPAPAPVEEGSDGVRPEVLAAVETYINRHGLFDLVRAIFRADGYTIGDVEQGEMQSARFHISRGRLGLESPKIFVNLMVDVDDLQAGEVQRFKATAEAHKVDALLVVGWHRPSAEMRSSLNREGLLLWTREDILRHLLENYGSLEARVQAELGLCQVWTVS